MRGAGAGTGTRARAIPCILPNSRMWGFTERNIFIEPSVQSQDQSAVTGVSSGQKALLGRNPFQIDHLSSAYIPALLGGVGVCVGSGWSLGLLGRITFSLLILFPQGQAPVPAADRPGLRIDGWGHHRARPDSARRQPLSPATLQINKSAHRFPFALRFLS